MGKKGAGTKKLVKLEFVILISFIALAVGFVGGVVFSAFKMQSSPVNASVSMNPQTTETNEALTDAQATEIATIEKAAERTPESAEGWIALGDACFDYNQTEKAIQAYEKALKYQPDNADVWTDLGVMYRRDGNPEKAIASFEKAQEVSPGHEMSLFNKGIVLMHDLNDMPGASAAWEKLLETHPDATTPGGMPVKTLVEKLKETN